MATLTVRCDLPVSEETPRDAQAFALLTVRAWRSEVSREDLVVVLDELTRAVLAHADGEHTLVLELIAHRPRQLTVCLSDGSAIDPIVHGLAGLADPAGASDGSGEVSLLHAALSVIASRWGHEPYLDGRRVWFEIGARPSALEPVDVDPAPARLGDAFDVDVDVDVECEPSDPDGRRPGPALDGAAVMRLRSSLGAPAASR
jgi:hypothetical protein